MKQYLYKIIEIYRYTHNIVFTLQSGILFGVLPILYRSTKINYFQYLYEKLATQWSRNILFTTPFGTFVAKTLNGWSVVSSIYEPSVAKIIHNNYIKYQNDTEKVFINIGAHIGRWIVEASQVYKYKCIAFEASQETYAYLQANIYLSGVSDTVSAFPFGISNSTGKKQFAYLTHHDGHNHIIGSEESVIGLKTNSINTYIFDDLVLPYDIKNVRLLVIDVEGHEYEVLQGMKKALNEFFSVDIIIEIFDDSPSKDQTINFLIDLGYQMKKISHADYVFSK